MSEDRKFTVMFVCSGNTCRSPMAEYALRSLLERERPGRSEIISAGTLGLVDQPATAHAQEAGKTWDLDLSPHRSQPLNIDLINHADLIFAMAPGHYREIVQLLPEATEKTYLLKSFPDRSPDGQGVEDPIGMDLQTYNGVFLEIGEYLGKHLPEIIKRLNEKAHAE